jgi:hypothetical protein
MDKNNEISGLKEDIFHLKVEIGHLEEKVNLLTHLNLLKTKNEINLLFKLKESSNDVFTHNQIEKIINVLQKTLK